MSLTLNFKNPKRCFGQFHDAVNVKMQIVGIALLMARTIMYRGCCGLGERLTVAEDIVFRI